MTVSNPACEPPAYDSISSIDFDKLPPYSNSIHLVTLCRRKLEYTAPNVPARKGTRGWHFYWLVLYGTALNIYRPIRSEVNAHRKREAVIRAARLEQHNRANRARRSKNSSEPSYNTPERTPDVLDPHPNQYYVTNHQSPSSSLPLSPSPSPVQHKRPFDAPKESPDGLLTTSPEPPSPLTPNIIGGKPHPDSQTRPDLRTHKLVKQYTMNGATCVRAYDYLRRYFVLRIRADGQQFMVQLNSYPETHEWLAVSIIVITIFF